MNFNIELYQQYRKIAGYAAKDGFWDVTRFPNGSYCFATNQWLGDNGKIDEHPLYGVKIRKKGEAKEYTIDSVNIHWNKGYYYFVTMVDEKGSHATGFIGNINCIDEMYLEFINEFWTKWEKV